MPHMNIEIRRLTPDMAEEYVHFFDVTPHDVNVDENKCYCVTWRNDETYFGDDHWYPTREERRSRAAGFVKNGQLQGYMAYCGGEAVGWCNATGDCRGGVKYLSEFWPIEEDGPGIRVKSIFCFVVAPKMQRKGVATAFVERVCKDAAEEGFDFVEAYVNKEFVDTANDFRGPITMFEKCGFTKSAEREGRVTVRKALK